MRGLLTGRTKPNPIRNWSGVLHPRETGDKHLTPLREQLESGIPHEREFGFFATLDGVDGLFVDVGANAGQSAVSLRTVNSSLRILSFEPNPLLEPVLRRLRDEVLDGFDYRMTGLSDRHASMVLYVPVVDGAHVTPLATLDRSLFDRQEHHDRLVRFSLHGTYKIAEVAVQLQRLDDLDLEPTVIKIDAEEHELSCLAGMMETIERYSPILMIENNPQRDQIADRLRAVGYEPFLYDPDSGDLVPFPASVESVNLFYVRRQADV